MALGWGWQPKYPEKTHADNGECVPIPYTNGPREPFLPPPHPPTTLLRKDVERNDITEDHLDVVWPPVCLMCPPPSQACRRRSGPGKGGFGEGRGPGSWAGARCGFRQEPGVVQTPPAASRLGRTLAHALASGAQRSRGPGRGPACGAESWTVRETAPRGLGSAWALEVPRRLFPQA